jgi:hypothetical protein
VSRPDALEIARDNASFELERAPTVVSEGHECEEDFLKLHVLHRACLGEGAGPSARSSIGGPAWPVGIPGPTTP